MQLGYIQRKQSLASHRRQHSSSSSSMDDAMQCSAVRCTHHAVFPILKPPSKQIRPAESSTHHSSHPFSFRQARGDLFFHQASNPLPFAHTANATNSTLPSITFQSPCFKLQSAPQLRLRPPRRPETGGAVHTRKPGLPLKPIHAALGPDRNGGLNNPNRRGATLPSSPLSDVVHEFYSSLNEKNSKSLDKLIAPDCIIEDTAYYKPLDVKVIFSSGSASAFQGPFTCRRSPEFRSPVSSKERTQEHSGHRCFGAAKCGSIFCCIA